MINPKTNQRELCYVVIIDNIEPIVGSNNCEAAIIGGWKVMVRKNTFKIGSPAIYFEIDSKVDTSRPEFAFLEKKHGAIKTQKYTFGGKNPGFYSQGLLMAAEDFGWTVDFAQFAGDFGYIIDDKGIQHIPGDESAFLTEQLGVTYYEAEDNKRKAKVNPDAKINAALARHPYIAKKFGKTIKKNKILRKIFILLFGRKKDVRNWPSEVKRTDEERIENRLWTLNDQNKKWIATEKIDGTSTTFHMRRKKGLKPAEFFVCSRNVVFDTPNKKNFYSDTIGNNVYLSMAEKYNIQKVLNKLLDMRPSADWVTIQGETFGKNIQKRDYKMPNQDFRAFNLIFSDIGRLNTIEMKNILDKMGVPSVPIVDTEIALPKTIEELREYVHNTPSFIDGDMREGIVFRSLDGQDSFKCVDPAFLIRFHG